MDNPYQSTDGLEFERRTGIYSSSFVDTIGNKWFLEFDYEDYECVITRVDVSVPDFSTWTSISKEELAELNDYDYDVYLLDEFGSCDELPSDLQTRIWVTCCYGTINSYTAEQLTESILSVIVNYRKTD